MMYPINVNTSAFLLVPLGLLLVISLLVVLQAVKGHFHPPSIFVRGLGGAIYILGFGLTSLNAMIIDPINGGTMLWGLAIMLTPRFLSAFDDLTPAQHSKIGE